MESYPYTPMPQKTRDVFEKFVTAPQHQLAHDELMVMLLYIRDHGIHRVYCKIKQFMPLHHDLLRAQARRICR